MPRGYHCKFGTPGATDFLPIMLYEDRRTPPEVRSSFVPATDGPSLADEIFSDWSNGLGFSQPGQVRNGYAYGEFVDTRSAGMVLPAGALTELSVPVTVTGDPQILGDFHLGSHWYLISTRYIFRFVNGVGNPEVFYDHGSETFDGTAVVADYGGTRTAFLGRSVGGFSKFDGSTFTHTASFGRSKLAAVWFTTPSGVSVRHLVGTGADEYRITTCPLSSDPMSAGSWGSDIVVGEGAYPIRSLTSAGRHVYVNTTGGVYDLNELGETLALTPYHQDGADAENGLACRFYDRYVMYNSVLGIDAVDVSQPGLRHADPFWVMPGGETGQSNETPIWGRPTSATIDGGWYVTSIFNNRDSYVIYGKPRPKLGVEGPTPWVWHGALAKFANQKVSHLRVRALTEDSVRARYLYVATEPHDGAGASRVFRQSLPRSTSAKQEYDALVAGTITVSHRFYPGFTLVNTPREWGEPTRQKSLIRTDVGSRNLTGGNSMSVSVSEDEAAYGDPIGAVTVSPLQAIPTTSDAPQGLQLGIKVVASSTATVPAILRSITARAVIDHEEIEELEMDVLLIKGQSLANQSHQTQRSDTVMWRQLAAKRNTIQTFTTPLDEDVTVLVDGVMPSSIRPVEPNQTGGDKGWARVAKVRMKVLDSGARYDSGALYDVDAYG